MRRLLLPVVFVLGFLAAGGLSAGVIAATTSSTTTTAATTTTTTTTTTTAPPPAVLPDGVTVGGVPVGGLSPEAAETQVRAAFARPLALRVVRRTFHVPPGRLGAVAYVHGAVVRAEHAAAGTAVPLTVVVRGRAARSYIAGLAHRVDHGAVDARVVLRNLRPYVIPDRSGRVLDRTKALRLVVHALVAGKRGPLRLPVRRVTAAVSRAAIGPVIVIRRGSHRLFLYRGSHFWRVFSIAVGQPSYPTPLGHFYIAVMWRNPWWYPPDSPWAAGASPIPPGPGNPLGTRWMGLSAPGVGIHGTPDAASIGYSASHGCIRMRIPEAEWLFNHVTVGTPVFIVPA